MSVKSELGLETLLKFCLLSNYRPGNIKEIAKLTVTPIYNLMILSTQYRYGAKLELFKSGEFNNVTKPKRQSILVSCRVQNFICTHLGKTYQSMMIMNLLLLGTLITYLIYYTLLL